MMLLTLDSTFQDIRDLLENGDEYFNQIISFSWRLL